MKILLYGEVRDKNFSKYERTGKYVLSLISFLFYLISLPHCMLCGIYDSLS